MISFNFQSVALILLFVNVLAVGITTSLVIFTIINQQQQQQVLQDRSTHSINAITSRISDKIDKVQNQTLSLLNSQGNLSAQQRSQLIEEFQAVESEGGLATKNGQANNSHILQEILGNLTELNNKQQ